MSTSSVVFGFHPVRELLRHRPQQVTRLWLVRRSGQRRAQIAALAERHGIAVVEVTERELRGLVGAATHNGVAAEVGVEPETSAEGGDSQLQVLVEDVQDPRNLGALLRVCEGAGVGSVLIRDRGSATITGTVAKVSAGATEWLPIERVTNTARTLEARKAEGFWIYGADAAGEAPWDVDLTGPVVLCIGGEQGGLRALTRTTCDRLVGLPLYGRVESLNLATAAAALLYEAVRQRLQSAS